MRPKYITTYYVVNINGKLIGYTSDVFLLNELRRYKKALMCDNIFIHTYHCDSNRLYDILIEDYLAEEIYGVGVELLESTKLHLYTSTTGKSVITSYGAIYEAIETSDCVNMVAHGIVKSLYGLIRYVKYIRDPSVRYVLDYITLTYTKKLMKVSSLSGNIIELLDDDTICLDILDILIDLGYIFAL